MTLSFGSRCGKAAVAKHFKLIMLYIVGHFSFRKDSIRPLMHNKFNPGF